MIIEGHTRDISSPGPAICAECSREIQDYVNWPCEVARKAAEHAIVCPAPWDCPCFLSDPGSRTADMRETT